MYAHVTPRVPSRRGETSEQRRFVRDVPQSNSTTPRVHRSLREDLHKAALPTPLPLDSANFRRSSSSSSVPSSDDPSMEVARGVFGALAREYGDLNKCPEEALQVAMAVCGIANKTVVEELKQAIGRSHQQEFEDALKAEELIRSKSPRSVEWKRALLEKRLRYHILLPAEPPQPSVKNQRSFVREYILAGSPKSADRHRSLHETAPKLSTSPALSPVSGGTATPGLSSRSSSNGVVSRLAHSKNRPSTANAQSLRARLSPRRSPDQRQMQLELLNMRRVFIDLPSRVPPLHKVQQQKSISTATVDGQVQLFSEIFNLIDIDGNGKIDRDQFIAFGRKISGSDASRVFSVNMFLLICKTVQSKTPVSGRMRKNSDVDNSNEMQQRSAIVGEEANTFITRDMFLAALFPGASSKIQSFRRSQQDAVAAAIAAEGQNKRWEDDWAAEDMKLLLVMFRGCDQDADGFVSPEDLVRFSSQHNTGKDKFSEHEYQNALRMYKAQMSSFDRDGDGRVDLEEFSRMQKPVFDMQNKREEEQEPALLFKGVKTLW
ncbi:calcium-binding protein, putative [Bodo saltans]|uniref:Calcium-binding protein, putative n=1 Tax=Bodo saltans TaxID=75058 RepID=A0A0S4JU19_BODSA|nr:calcium-binding protein, putative [Bodo saltans]|eukprot:CUG93503.1 calcium-binding protein, putative [Bodo saltans]